MATVSRLVPQTIEPIVARNMNSLAGSPLPLLRGAHEPVVASHEQRARVSRAPVVVTSQELRRARERWFLIIRV